MKIRYVIDNETHRMADVLAACLCGATGPISVAQWARDRLKDAPVGAQGLVPVGLPPGRAPCAATLHRV